MFCSVFPQEHVINSCHRTNICDYFGQINVSGDILYAGGNVEEQEDFGFSGSLKKTYHYRWKYQKEISWDK